MPIANITIMEGRDDEKKANLIASITDAIEESLGAPRESIRVILNEVPKSHFGIAGKSAKELGK